MLGEYRLNCSKCSVTMTVHPRWYVRLLEMGAGGSGSLFIPGAVAMRSALAGIVATVVVATMAQGQVPTIDQILEKRQAHDRQLTQISLTFTDRIDKPKNPDKPHIELITRCAAKGEKRFFEVKATSNISPELARRLHRGMSFDGKETRVLEHEGNALIRLGDGQK